MNERFVALGTVTGSRIRGCSAKPRCDFSVTRGWQLMMNAIRWIKQSAEKNHGKVLSHLRQLSFLLVMSSSTAVIQFDKKLIRR